MKTKFFYFIYSVSKILKIFPNVFLIFVYHFSMFIPTIIGVLIRSVLVSALCQTGRNIYVGTNVVIKNFSKLKIGNNVSIHENCYIDAVGQISIGNNVSIAHNTSLISFEHGWDNPLVPIKYNSLRLSPIYIDDDIWIGCGVRILSGSHLSSRTIVAAGAVVKGGFSSNSIIAGVPAKLIREI